MRAARAREYHHRRVLVGAALEKGRPVRRRVTVQVPRLVVERVRPDAALPIVLVQEVRHLREVAARLQQPQKHEQRLVGVVPLHHHVDLAVFDQLFVGDVAHGLRLSSRFASDASKF